MNGPIRVVIAEDQALLRGSLRLLLDSETDMDVVGEAGTGADAVRLADLHRPDVVLMDIRMPEIDGVEATRLICSSDRADSVKVLILTTFDDDEYVYGALRGGASGFLLKDTPPTDLLEGIRTIANGDALLSPRVTRRVVSHFAAEPAPKGKPNPRLEDLTPRERQVLEVIARGLSNAEIADELYVSQATVKTHISHLRQKLHTRDRAQLVIVAYETGLV